MLSPSAELDQRLVETLARLGGEFIAEQSVPNEKAVIRFNRMDRMLAVIAGIKSHPLLARRLRVIGKTVDERHYLTLTRN